MDDLSSFGYAITRYSLGIIAFSVGTSTFLFLLALAGYYSGIPAATIFMEATPVSFYILAASVLAGTIYVYRSRDRRGILLDRRYELAAIATPYFLTPIIALPFGFILYYASGNA